MAGNDLSRRIRDALPLLPFLAVVVIFLIVPTVTVIVSAVYVDGVFSLARIGALFSETALAALWKSVLLSGTTALLGARARCGAGLVDREQPAVVDGAPRGDLAVQRAGPVRRRRTGIRVPGHGRASTGC